MIKHSTVSQKRNIQLIPLADSGYQNYLLQFKTEKKSEMVYDKPARKKSEIMGYLLELVVSEWVKRSKINLEERIITYEYGDGKKIKKIFKEVDYVLKQGKRFIVGEIKVSSSSNGMVTKACEQLTFSKELLSHLSNSVTMQIIRVDLNFQNATTPLDDFDDDFLKSNFRYYEWNDIEFEILHLNAQDVFNYGVRNKIIKSPEIFESVIYETGLIHLQRQAKIELKNLKKSVIEETNIDVVKSIEDSINQLELRIFLVEIESNLSQQGWAYLSNKDHEDFSFIVDYLGDNCIHDIQGEDFDSRVKGFCTEDKIAKFISYYCSEDEIEFDLLDAERVYLLLPEEQGYELQTIEFEIENPLQTEKVSYPLFSKFPCRKFFYSNKLVRPEDCENDSLKHFEYVINNSQPIKVLLKRNDILIFDNHRLLHKKNSTYLDHLQKRIVME